MSATFSYTFQHPNGESPQFHVTDVTRTELIPFYIPKSIIIGVTNGGPNSLEWTAAVLNERTNAVISDYHPFIHGNTALKVSIWENSIIEGDKLSLILHNNSGRGSITIFASPYPY